MRVQWLLAAAAAVLLVAFVALLNWSGKMSNVGLPRVASQSPFRASIEQMPTITQVSWEGPSFATNASGWQPATNVSAGAVTLRARPDGEAWRTIRVAPFEVGAATGAVALFAR